MLRILRVLAPNPDVYTLEGTNTWVIGADPAVVIDPGPQITSHLDEVARIAGPVGAVLVTHDHPDHAPAAPHFAQRQACARCSVTIKGCGAGRSKTCRAV
jgi:Zn-dependent hydrolases, including glyoxylases